MHKVYITLIITNLIHSNTGKKSNFIVDVCDWVRDEGRGMGGGGLRRGCHGVSYMYVLAYIDCWSPAQGEALTTE